jgi:hypothetical protein
MKPKNLTGKSFITSFPLRLWFLYIVALFLPKSCTTTRPRSISSKNLLHHQGKYCVKAPKRKKTKWKRIKKKKKKNNNNHNNNLSLDEQNFYECRLFASHVPLSHTKPFVHSLLLSINRFVVKFFKDRHEIVCCRRLF